MKNTIKAITLAAVLMFGTTFTMAGILVSDSKEGTCPPAADKEGIIVFGANEGIIVFGAAGIIVFGTNEGIIVFGGKDDTKQCTERNGILVSD